MLFCASNNLLHKLHLKVKTSSVFLEENYGAFKIKIVLSTESCPCHFMLSDTPLCCSCKFSHGNCHMT